MTAGAEHVPQHDGRSAVLVVRETDLRRTLQQEVLRLAHTRSARKVALDVAREHRNAGARKPFCQHLQRHRLTGAGGTGDETVPVRKAEIEVFGLDALTEKDLAVLQNRLAHSCLRLPDGGARLGGNWPPFALGMGG